MKLGNFLEGGKTRPPVTRSVQFTAVVKGKAHEAPTTVQAKACLVFVTDDQRCEAESDALKFINENFKDKPVTDEIRRTVAAHHFLFAALRDEQKPGEPFADSVEELMGACVGSEPLRLMTRYYEFISDEFPEQVSEEDFKALVEEAKKKSLVELLSTFGSTKIRAYLASSEATRG